MSAALKAVPLRPVTDDFSPSMEVIENRSIGFVKLYRSLKNKAWYTKSEYVHLWVHLFLTATRKQKDEWFGGKTIQLKPGQLVTGRKKLSSETGIQESKVERILKCFENEQQIEQQTSNASRLLSILNWHLYQNVEQPPAQQMNSGRTTDEQRVNTIQEARELEEGKEVSKAHTPVDFYNKQIAENGSAQFIDKYKALVAYLHGKNDEDLAFPGVLKMEQQLTYKQYLKLREKWLPQGVDLRDVLKAMENDKRAIKDKKSVYLTLNTWAGIRTKK